MVTFEQQVSLLYEAAFDRPADTEGLKFHVDLLKSGASLLSVAQAFAASQEFQTRNQYAADDFMIAQNIFWNGLERSLTRDSAEGQMWSSYLANHDAGHVLYTIAASVEIVGSDVTWVL
jgi:hypothetical protein